MRQGAAERSHAFLRRAQDPDDFILVCCNFTPVPRHGYRILKDGAAVGLVTSGSFSPSLERGIGMGYVRADLAAVGSEWDVEIRGASQRARVVRTPFYPSKAKK